MALPTPHRARFLSPLLAALVALASGAALPAQSRDPAIRPVIASPMNVTDLRCEQATDPLGVDVPRPRLSWRLLSDERGQRQTAYQIFAASTREGLESGQADLWKSGRIESDQTNFIAYGGAPLASGQQVFWRLIAFDRDGRPTGWSPTATWTMGLLNPGDWKAQWITSPATTETLLLRRDFRVKRGLRRAVAFVSGLGHYELNLNGRKAGTDVLAPGWTDYDQTTLYDTRDVTALLHEGQNAAALTLGNGMYHVVRRNRFAKFTGSYGPLRAIMHLRLEYADDTVEFVATDEQWRTQAGPITFSSIYGGEDFDARLVPTGWDRAGFDDRAWSAAVAVNRPAHTLKGHTRAAEPVVPIETRPPASVRELQPGVLLYDFGQNTSFMPRLRVSGPAGSSVRLTGGEVLNDDGTIDRSTMGGAHRGSAWWQYTKATAAEETWFPQFYYVGSRYLYAELTPATEGGTRPKIEGLEMVIVHSAAEPSGEFKSSDETLNRIRDLVRWAQRSNMVSVLTDCPHREKLGWLEQTHLNGAALRYEWDLDRLYAKVVQDMREAQEDTGLVPNIAPEYTKFRGTFRTAAEWGAAFIMVPWQQYVFTGDRDLLREHYPAMRKYFAWLETRTKDGLLEEGLGDWYDHVLGKPGRANLTPPPVTATAFYYQDAMTLSKIAAVLGHEAEAKDYSARAQAIRARYIREFAKLNAPEIYGSGSDTSLALPLALDLVDAPARAQVFSSLVRNIESRGYASSGAAGHQALLRTLADGGRSDLVHRLATQDDKPGYAFQLKQGNTTLAESWPAARGASQNHFFLGQIVEWMYADVAGIRPDPEMPGFKRVIIAPQPIAALSWAEASYHSVHGKIVSRWERKDGKFTLTVTVPANTTAMVAIPTSRPEGVMESGVPALRAPGVKSLGTEANRALFAVESGTYVFSVKP